MGRGSTAETKAGVAGLVASKDMGGKTRLILRHRRFSTEPGPPAASPRSARPRGRRRRDWPRTPSGCGRRCQSAARGRPSRCALGRSSPAGRRRPRLLPLQGGRQNGQKWLDKTRILCYACSTITKPAGFLTPGEESPSVAACASSRLALTRGVLFKDNASRRQLCRPNAGIPRWPSRCIGATLHRPQGRPPGRGPRSVI